MRLKQIGAVTLAALMTAGTLAGCSGGTKTKETTGAQTAAAETTAASTDKKAASGEKTVINIWSKDRHDASYVQEKVDEYNKTNTDNIQVNYQLYTDNYVQAIDMAVQSGELPDIMVQQEQMFDKYVNEGQWANLYDFMDDDMKAYFKDVIFPGYNELDGKLYFISTNGTTCRLFYNKEIFARVGIAEPPKTLEEMVADSKLITSKLSGEGIYGFAENMKSASSGLQRSLMVGLQRETGLVNGYDFTKGEYDFTPWAESLKLWKELLSEDSAFPGCESLDIDPLRTQFAAGKIGMYMSYSHAEPGVYQNQFPMDSDKWDCVPIPTVGGKATGKQYFTGTGGYVLNAKSPNLEKAFKVYKDIFANEDYLVGYAAVAASRNGCNTLLIEQEAYFGGMATLASVPAFGPFTNGERDLIGGIGREILEELKKDGYKSPFYDRKPDRIEGIDWYPIDPEHLKRVMDELVTDSGCDVLFHTTVTEVRSQDGKIEAVRVFNKGGFQWIGADYFIDCTGDGDLAAMSGAIWEYGDENGRVQAGTLCFRVANIDVKRFMDYVNKEGETGNLSVAAEKAKRDGRFPLSETKVCGMSLQADGIAGLNFGHVYNLKPLDPWNKSLAEMEARRKLPELVAFLREYVPGLEACVLASSGPYLGIRESRRIRGGYTLTKEDYLNRADFPDAIAYYSYPIDIHASMPEEGSKNEELYQNSKYKNGECYGIPYRCLIPEGLKNLAVAGRTISADRIMMSSIRIMSPCFATGQAAGTAVALGLKAGGIDLDKIDTDRLRKWLWGAAG